MPTHVLAELNIARLVAPMDDPQIADFRNGLETINRLAESSPGFVWRLKDDSGNATNIHVYDDPLLIVNLTAWETVDDLFRYTYSSDHVDFFRRRAEWFSRLSTPSFVLWWQPIDQMPPSLDEAKARLDHLTAQGATPHAFTFKKRFTVEEAVQYTLAT
ncbi:MAG: DUF3291 domain-containing protein [Anaerolineae bacterium]|nr:DUF3291 domain-containing protein [Anaerolineae bacterium]